MIALGTIKDFSEGWAIVPFVEKPHYWLACGTVPVQGSIATLYRSVCGLRAGLISQRPLVPGNFPKCKRCQRSVLANIEYTDSAEEWAARKAE